MAKAMKWVALPLLSARMLAYIRRVIFNQVKQYSGLNDWAKLLTQSCAVKAAAAVSAWMGSSYK